MDTTAVVFFSRLNANYHDSFTAFKFGVLVIYTKDGDSKYILM